MEISQMLQNPMFGIKYLLKKSSFEAFGQSS
jgi:hypothetical protein